MRPQTLPPAWSSHPLPRAQEEGLSSELELLEQPEGQVLPGSRSR